MTTAQFQPKCTPSPVQLRKLAALANFLDDLPHRRFYMPGWVSEDATATSCGTAGCACGWAATVYAGEGWIIDDGVVCFGRRYGALAFAGFFGIDFKLAYWITIGFDRHGPKFPGYVEEFNIEKSADITPSMAAKRIRDVVLMYDPTGQYLDEPAPVLAERVAP
jgi:hypothetical protein